MQRFVLKKIFDIRPLNKKGELNLRWILKQGKTVKIKRILVSQQKKYFENKKRKEVKPLVNLPAWEMKRPRTSIYKYEDIREILLKELENIDLKESKLKRDFGPPLNLPIIEEFKKEKKAHTLLKKIFPQIINLKGKIPRFNLNLALSFKYIMVSLVVLAILLPSIYILTNIASTKNTVLISGKKGYDSLIDAQKSLLGFDTQTAAQNFKNAYDNFSIASRAINTLGGSLLDIVDILPLRYKISTGKNLLEAGQLISKAGEELALGFKTFSNLKLPDFISGNKEFSLAKNTPIYALKKFKESFSLAKNNLNEGIDKLKAIKTEDLPSEYKDGFASLESALPGLESTIDNFDNYFNFILAILGDQSPRYYLIVFENNSEIRATGGFIGSYALLKVYQGQIDNIDVKNIFDADGQLIVNVIPPKPIQKISSGWSTHDANWFFDFPTSAQKIAWFFEKTGGPTVDGIVTVTPRVIEQLLDIFGPINLPKYNLKVTKNNFVEEIQSKVEEDYDPYLNEPKKILSDFTASLIVKLSNANKSVWAQIIKNFKDELLKKDLMLWLKNQDEEKFIIKQGWSGSIQKTPGDYLAIVHSNINGYKTDRYMDEDINLNITFDKNKNSSHQLVIRRIHKGGDKKYSWYNKVNSDYIRIYLPKGAKIINAFGNNPEFIAPPLDYESLKFKTDPTVVSVESTLIKEPNSGVDIFEESGKTVVGAWLYTSPGEETVFKLNYLVPNDIIANNINKLPDTTSEKISYNLVFQRQPGADDSPLRISINYPNSWRVQQVYPRERLISQNPIRFKDVIDTDKFFNINFKIYK